MNGVDQSKAQSDLGRALRDAASRGDVAAIARSIATAEGKAAIDSVDGQGQSALLLAIQRGHDQAAIALIDAGADINRQAANQDTPWLLAGASGRTAALKRMLATGKVDYAKRNRYGGNALIPACERGHVETVRLLVTESKIDLDHVNNLAWTALLEAIVLGDGGPRHVEIVRLLVAHKANVNLADGNGQSPLALARARGQSAIVRILEEAGAR